MDCVLRISQSNNWYIHKSCAAPHREASTGTAGYMAGMEAALQSFQLPFCPEASLKRGGW